MQIDRLIANRFIGAATALAALTLALAVLIGFGWLAGIDSLPGALSGETNMKLNVAVCVGAVAISLILATLGHPTAARAFGVPAALIAGLTLLEYIAGSDFGIDELLVSDDISPGIDNPGRMAPNTAVSLLLLGIASITWGFGDGPVMFSKAVAAVGLILGLLGLTGYATGTTDLFGVGDFTRMSAPTAFAITALGFAHILSVPDRGLTAIITETGAGGELARSLLPAIIGAPLFTGWLVFEASDAGLYDVRAAAWILLIALITSLTIATLLMARSIGLVEGRRRESEQRGLEFFRLSRDMLATVNRDGFLVDLNDAWTEVLGFSLEELSSQAFIEFIHDDDRARARSSAAELFSGSGSVTFENRWRTKDGGWRRLLWSAVVSPRSDLIVARVTDITDLKRQEAELMRTVDELARSNEDLEQFASVASHDLSEPLRTIKGFSQLLERRYTDQFDDRGRHYLGMIVEGTERLQELIHDLLTYSRAGQKSVEISEFDLQEIVDEVVAGLGTRMEETSATISVGALPRIAADRTKIAQLMQNLVSNALTYTQDKPSIRITGERMGASWEITVDDNGIGIPPHQRERVFDPFRRLHTRAQYAGSGIGLSVCRRIVERHGGEIWAEESSDGGARIIFTLPTNLSPGSAVIAISDPRRTTHPAGAGQVEADI